MSVLFSVLLFFLFLSSAQPVRAACQVGASRCSGGWIEKCMDGIDWESWSSCDCGSCRNGSSCALCCLVECACSCNPTESGGTCTSCCDADHQNCACDCTPNTSGGSCKSCCNPPYDNPDLYPCGCTNTTGGGSPKSCCDSYHGGKTSPTTACPWGCTADVYGGDSIPPYFYSASRISAMVSRFSACRRRIFVALSIMAGEYNWYPPGV